MKENSSGLENIFSAEMKYRANTGLCSVHSISELYIAHRIVKHLLMTRYQDGIAHSRNTLVECPHRKYALQKNTPAKT